MNAGGLLVLMHVLGVLHLFRVPFTAFCDVAHVRVVSRGLAYCLPARALELWRAA